MVKIENVIILTPMTKINSVIICAITIKLRIVLCLSKEGGLQKREAEVAPWSWA